MGEATDQKSGNGSLDQSVCPGVAWPETVLVARMTGGSYFLMAYPQREPAAFVARPDAALLHDALEAAFGYPTAKVARENGDPAPEDSALPGKRVQP
ncbi:MAG TPA: hypothetical protein VIY28_11980 [Pseudonocardiaceae bacterium]